MAQHDETDGSSTPIPAFSTLVVREERLGQGYEGPELLRCDRLSVAFYAIHRDWASATNAWYYGVERGEASDSEDVGGADNYITLDQAAAVVGRSKRTLERYLENMPTPDVEGGGGKPHEWKWSTLRPWLMENFDRDLPERFPASRTI